MPVGKLMWARMGESKEQVLSVMRPDERVTAEEIHQRIIERFGAKPSLEWIKIVLSTMVKERSVKSLREYEINCRRNDNWKRRYWIPRPTH